MITYMIFSFVVIAYYNADLTASLTVQEKRALISDLSDLAIPGRWFAVGSGSGAEAYFKNPDRAEYFPQMVPKPNYQSCLNALYSGEVLAVISDGVTQSFLSNTQPCDKWAVGDIFVPSNFGIGLAYGNDTAKRQISDAILAIRENGILDNILNAWLQAGACNDDSNLSSDKLTLLDLSGAFVILGVFILLAIISLIIENGFFYWYSDTTTIKPAFTKHIDRFLGNSEPEQRKNRVEISESNIATD